MSSVDDLPGLLSFVRRRLREGPNAGLKRDPGWRWPELGWCLLVLAWFGTTGRPMDLLVAAGLIITWIFGPAVGVFIAGHLAILALGLLPALGWALLATEFILIVPLLVELRTVVDTPPLWGVYSGTTTAFVGVATAGLWFEWPLVRTAGVLGGLYVLWILGEELRIMLETNTNAQHDGNASEETS